MTSQEQRIINELRRLNKVPEKASDEAIVAILRECRGKAKTIDDVIAVINLKLS